ncbi:unnamed protein product [Withania somnifera]
MEEQFILRVPPSVAERIDRLLSENVSFSEDKLDLSFSEDGETGTFVLGDERFPASLLNLPCILESYKTYDDNVLIKSADVGQPELVRRVERDLQNIMAGGTAENIDIEVAEQEEGGEASAHHVSKKVAQPATKRDISEPGTAGEDPDRTESDDSDDSI